MQQVLHNWCVGGLMAFGFQETRSQLSSVDAS